MNKSFIKKVQIWFYLHFMCKFKFGVSTLVQLWYSITCS